MVGRGGAILGFTLANDVSAWDIERENPLYLPQSKVYNGCFSFGPVIVTPDEVRDPYALELTAGWSAAGREVFCGSASTAPAQAPLPGAGRLAAAVQRRPRGHRPLDGHGDHPAHGRGPRGRRRGHITCPEIGELRNPVALV